MTTIQLPSRQPNQTEQTHIENCRKVLHDKLKALNIDPMSIYPTSIGEMKISGDTISWDMSMSYTRCENDNN